MRGSPCSIWFLLSVLLGCAMAAGEKRPGPVNYYDWFKLPPVENLLMSDFGIFAQGRSIYGLLYDVGYLTDPDVKTQLSKALKYELLSNRDYIPRNHEFPPVGLDMRSFNPKFLDKFSWARYSALKNAVF